jgi:eukaryotic-like serine/threonine-protein kinase
MNPSTLPPPSGLPSKPPEEETLARGATLGRYVVVDVLGRGGMGVVYAAYDTQLDRRIAIKLLRRDVSRGDNAAEVESRMLREAQAMARLTHPNVVAVHDVGTFDHRVFLAMDYVDGWTLKEWVKTPAPRPWRERLEALISAGKGLAAAHAVGLVHRDFKPDNVLVGRDGRVLVTDFGLARIAGTEAPKGERAPEGEAKSAPPSRRSLASLPVAPTSGGSISAGTPLDANLTLTGSIMGTIGFMPPEQAFGEVTNAATDQFSYCATAYYALYGERPFPGEDLNSYLEAVERPPREPPKAAPVPRWVYRILVRGLSPRPDKRFASMEALLDALRDDPAIVRRRWAGGALAVVLLGGAALLTSRAIAHQQRECVVDARELDGVWDAPTKQDVRVALTNAGGTQGGALATRVENVLDDVAAKWVRMRTDVCEATYVRHQQSADVERLRIDCLDRRKTELRALTTVLRRADAQVSTRAVDAAYGLTGVSFCADVQGLRASAGLPDDPAARARVVEARGELARAGSLSLAGKLNDALAAAEGALAIARESKHPSTIAEALYLIGEVDRGLGDYPAAAPALSESTWIALSSGTDAVAARAASLEAFVVGAKLRRPNEAHVWLGVADATLAHLGGSEEIAVDVAAAKGVVLAEADWQPDKALAVDEQNLKTYRRLYGIHPKTARATYAIGVDHLYLGQHAEALPYYEQALAMSESIGGPTYTEVGRASYALGDCVISQGDYARGDQSIARALSIFEYVGTAYWSAITLQVASRSALVQGDVPRAVAAARRALGFMDKLATVAVLVPIVDVTAADALLASGENDEALALCDAALAVEEQSGQLDPKKVFGWDALRCRGDALIHLGRAREAIPLLERSLTLERRVYPGDVARVRFALARAIAQVGGDDARARTLASQARDDLAAFPFLKVDKAAVDKWLATHTK